ncbi:Na+/H+ antiporter NhaA [Aquimarina sp. SS2-1]|uniref:Na+/H+ antiporter NhaA n=1 Tax=Aquimarina besae TaxID=3342247 RepID=UPI00366DA6C9
MKESIASKIEGTVTNWFSKDSSLGFLLVTMVIIAMVWANSPWSDSYFHLFETKFVVGFENAPIKNSLHHWINDGLMALFFFLVGLEIKKEIINGELSSLKSASLPIFGALGGMIVPVIIFLLINNTGEASDGWGIAMATDIAFSLGLISLVSCRVSTQLKTFLTALATIDDIGAILVIAIFLTPHIEFNNLLIGGICFLIMGIGNIIGIRSIWFYILVGIPGLWISLLFSGVHATLAGVLAAFTIPGRTKLTEGKYKEKLKLYVTKFNLIWKEDSSLLSIQHLNVIEKVIASSKDALTPLQHLERKIAPFINFTVLPLFALANAGVKIEGDILDLIFHPVCYGIIIALFIGKLLGIVGFSYIATTFAQARLPGLTNWKKMGGIGLFGGIGFTMSLFIAELAFTNEVLLQHAKIGVILGSFLSAVAGILWLSLNTKKINQYDEEESIELLENPIELLPNK